MVSYVMQSQQIVGACIGEHNIISLVTDNMHTPVFMHLLINRELIVHELTCDLYKMVLSKFSNNVCP